MINPERTTFGALTYPTFSSGMEIVTTQPRASRPLSLSDLYRQALKDARDSDIYSIRSRAVSLKHILKAMTTHILTGNFATDEAASLYHKAHAINTSVFLPHRRTPPWSTEKRVRICTLVLKMPWMSLIPTSRRQLPPSLALVRYRMGMISPACVSIPILLWWPCFQLRALSHSIVSSCWYL